MTTPRLLSNRYELGETLGYGGMSEVHKGRDVRLSRDVAVKVLRADLARDPQFQTRFRREAQNAAALNHPAIVAVYDTGETQTEHGSLPYIVMEFVEGRTLRDLVKSEGPLAGKRAMEIMADICAALDFSHRHGIVHRDVKPANVMITRTGAVKVMDFGIARAVNDGQAAVTQTAAVIGTAQYLSPEQARGEAVDARSDVYAAGCVLFELLTGEPPFTGDSPVAVAYQHVREDPRNPSMVNPRVSPALDAIVLKAMSKNPANRYQSSAEMRADLVRVLSGQQPQAPLVMSERDRTALMGSSGATEVVQGRHRPQALTDDEMEDERSAKRRRAVIVTVVTLLCLGVLALAAYLTTSMLSHNGGTASDPTATTTPQVTVPDVRNQTETQARATLYGLGLGFTPTYVVVTDPNQVGKVTDINPQPGTQVPKGTSVAITYGKAPDQAQVPDLGGMLQSDAQTAITQAGFQMGKVTQQTVDDPTQAGKVTTQNPPARQLAAKGSLIDISIGKAPDTVAVPNVTGQPYDTAASNLQTAGFNAQRQDVDSTDPAGTVTGQNPSAGNRLAKNSTVVLKVSKGNLFKMPDLTGMTTSDAQIALANKGWSGTLMRQQTPVSDSTQNGKIVNQDIAPNSTVNRETTTTITVYVGKYSILFPPTTTTPSH